MEIRTRRLPPKTDRLEIKGVSYLGSKFKIVIKLNSSYVSFLKVNKELPLNLLIGNKVYVVEENRVCMCFYVFINYFFLIIFVFLYTVDEIGNEETVVIKETGLIFESCPLPLDVIGKPLK